MSEEVGTDIIWTLEPPELCSGRDFWLDCLVDLGLTSGTEVLGRLPLGDRWATRRLVNGHPGA
jgi:hypothetical protein